MKFEDLLKEIGDEHRYQMMIILLLLIPTSFFNAYFEGLFILSTPDHWCRVPELEHLPYELQHRLIRPIIDGEKSSCQRYDIINHRFNETILNDNFLNETKFIVENNNDNDENSDSLMNNLTKLSKTISCTDGWIYDQSLYSETAVTWFDLVCHRDYYVKAIMSLSSIGLAMMTPLLSNLSDRIGRRKALLLTLITAELSCLSPLVFKDIYSFLLARFLAGGVLNVFFQLPFVMVQELTSQQYRTKSSCISAITYSLGSCSVTGVLKLTGDWVSFTWIQFTITTLFLLGFRWIPESPSWLISKKRYDEAYKQLTQIARFNKKEIPEDLMEKIKSLKQEEDDVADDSFLDLFLRPGLRSKTFSITIVFLACIIGYGGIVVNTSNLEAKNQLWNIFLLSFVDLPSSFVCWKLVSTRLGRRWTNVVSLVLCGIALLIPALHPTYHQTFYTVCTLIGKFGIAGTFMVVYQHASELYPTTLRNQGMGVTATIGSIGGILAPQIVHLAKFGAWIPLFIIGIICLLAAIIASFLPETLNEYLPQRAKQAAEFGKDRPYFCLAKIDKPKTSSTSIVEEEEEIKNFNQSSSPTTTSNGHVNGNFNNNDNDSHNKQQQSNSMEMNNNNV